MDLYNVKFYQNSQGKDIIQEFIDKQGNEVAGRITYLILALKVKGPYLRMPYAKKISFSLFELRVTGRVSIRMLYTSHKGKFYILHIFKKKTQKIPRKEIQIALDRLEQFI